MTEFVSNSVARQSLLLTLLRQNLVLSQESLVTSSIAKKPSFVATEFVTNFVATKSGFFRKEALSLALSRQNLLRDLFFSPFVDDITSSLNSDLGV